MGRHSSPTSKGSLLSALKPRKRRTGRHTPEPASAGGVLAAVRSRPVLSAFVVPAAATAAVAGSTFAMVPGAEQDASRVVAQSPVVVEVPAAGPTTDEALKKAEEQAKEKPGKVSLEVKTQAPKTAPAKAESSSKKSSGAKTGGASQDSGSGSSSSGKSGGQSGSCPMSYYGGGDGTDGNPTASGEPFDASKLTAAHKSLPLGTKVKVTNTANGKSVTVRINDRGPYSGSRCIDLSKAAMQAVGGISAGEIQGSWTVL